MDRSAKSGLRARSGMFVMLGFSLVACVTRDEGDRLQEQSRQQAYQIREMEQRLAVTQKELEEARGKLEQLELTANSASKASANLVADFQNLQDRASQLQGRLETLTLASEQSKARQRELEKKIASRPSAGSEVTLSSADIPKTANALFEKAESSKAAGKYAEARALYRAFTKNYKSDRRAGAAQYNVGRTYMEEGKPASALGAFRKVLSDYASSSAADKTLLDMGRAFYQLQACSDAKAAYQALIRQYRRSPLRPKAQKELRDVNRAPRSACTS